MESQMVQGEAVPYVSKRKGKRSLAHNPKPTGGNKAKRGGSGRRGRVSTPQRSLKKQETLHAMNASPHAQSGGGEELGKKSIYRKQLQLHSTAVSAGFTPLKTVSTVSGTTLSSKMSPKLKSDHNKKKLDEVNNLFWFKTYEVLQEGNHDHFNKNNISTACGDYDSSTSLSPLGTKNQVTWIFPKDLLGRNGRVSRRNGLLHGCVSALRNFNLADKKSFITLDASVTMSRKIKFSDAPILIPRHCCTLQELHPMRKAKGYGSDMSVECLSAADNENTSSASTSESPLNLAAPKMIVSKPAYVLLWRYVHRQNERSMNERFWVVIEAQLFPTKWFGSDFEMKHPNIYSYKIHILDQIRTVRTFEDSLVAAWCLAGNLELTLRELGFNFCIKELSEGRWKGFPECTLSVDTKPLHDCVRYVTVSTQIPIINFYEETIPNFLA